MTRIGIVGAGIRGRLFARALRDRATLVGFAESSPTVREEIEAQGIPVYAEYHELYEAERPDAVIVATPDFAHRDAAVDAVRAGANILVEKPLATTVDDARAIQDAADRAGVHCMVGFENRWNPHFVAVRRARDAGRLGRPVAQHMTLSNTLEVPTRMLGWAARSSPLWFLGPHAVDLTLWLAGARPVSVFARGYRGVLAARGIDTWDTVQVSLKLQDDSLVDISCAWILPESEPAVVEGNYRMLTTDGAARVDLRHQGLSISGDSYASLNPLDQEVDDESLGIAGRMARRFVRDLQTGVQPVPGVEQGVLVTETIAAVERSLDGGAPIDIPPAEES